MVSRDCSHLDLVVERVLSARSSRSPQMKADAQCVCNRRLASGGRAAAGRRKASVFTSLFDLMLSPLASGPSQR